MKELTYLIYIVFWELFTLGGGSYIVFWKDNSGWWMVLFVALSTMAYHPRKWIHGKE